MALSAQVVVICGPTGAGKSGVAVQLCRAIVDRQLAPRAEVGMSRIDGVDADRHGTDRVLWWMMARLADRQRRCCRSGQRR